MFVYVLIKDDLGEIATICGVYSNYEAAERQKIKLDKENWRPGVFVYMIKKFPILD